MHVLRHVLAAVLAVVGAGVGYLGWMGLMWVFATLCRGLGNWLFCAGLGGPNILDLLTLPVLVVGGAVGGWRLGSSIKRSAGSTADWIGRGATPGRGDDQPAAVAYGYLEADVEVELVDVGKCQADLAKIMKTDVGVRRRVEGLARLRPSVARKPAEPAARGYSATHVTVEFEGASVGYLPDEVALAVAHNLRRFTAESGLDVYCPLQIVTARPDDGRDGEAFTVSVWLDARRSHQPEVVALDT